MLGKLAMGSLVFRRYVHGVPGVPATFYRGGTSRGLFFRTADLAQYTPKQRDAIICGAMGSPDPDGRQISGLGGGISSLSKCAIVGPPGALQRIGGDAFIGTLPDADDVSASQHPDQGWDVVYRFGQVPINGTKIDWGSTCGNLVAAAASFAIDSGAIPQERLANHAAAHPPQGDNPHGYTSTYPVRLFVACSGSVFTAAVPISKAGDKYVAAKKGDTVIAGVPGKFPGVQVAIPLAGPEEVFPSGKVKNVVSVDLPCVTGKPKQEEIGITLVDAGLAVSFVPAASLGLSSEDLALPVSELEVPTRGLMESLENVRYAGGMLSEKTRKVFSPPEPKICIIAPPQAYTTSSGSPVRAEEMDLLIRAVSVGNIHRTIPATTLSALAVAAATPGSVVWEMAGGAAAAAARAVPETGRKGQLATIRVGQPAGISAATVRFEGPVDAPSATDIVMVRSANRIMAGTVEDPFED